MTGNKIFDNTKVLTLALLVCLGFSKQTGLSSINSSNSSRSIASTAAEKEICTEEPKSQKVAITEKNLLLRFDILDSDESNEDSNAIRIRERRKRTKSKNKVNFTIITCKNSDNEIVVHDVKLKKESGSLTGCDKCQALEDKIILQNVDDFQGILDHLLQEEDYGKDLKRQIQAKRNLDRNYQLENECRVKIIRTTYETADEEGTVYNPVPYSKSLVDQKDELKCLYDKKISQIYRKDQLIHVYNTRFKPLLENLIVSDQQSRKLALQYINQLLPESNPDWERNRFPVEITSSLERIRIYANQRADILETEEKYTKMKNDLDSLACTSQQMSNASKSCYGPSAYENRLKQIELAYKQDLKMLQAYDQIDLNEYNRFFAKSEVAINSASEYSSRLSEDYNSSQRQIDMIFSIDTNPTVSRLPEVNSVMRSFSNSTNITNSSLPGLNFEFVSLPSSIESFSTSTTRPRRQN